MEYASGGTIYHAARGTGGRLPEERVWKYLIQALLGLDYIHQKRIVHRDIKSLNLFLDASDCVKIGDFGIARCLSDGTDMLRTIVGTPFYLSPELCEDRPYNERSDIWALGITLVRRAPPAASIITHLIQILIVHLRTVLRLNLTV